MGALRAKRLRPFLHQTPEVASGVLSILLRALRSALRDASPGAYTATSGLACLAFTSSSTASVTAEINDGETSTL
jgi:hypothetical protein